MLPTPSDLVNHPELAVLSILDTAAQTAIRALAAVHPELQESDPDYADDGTALLPSIAHCLVIQARSLSHVLDSYRQVVEQASRAGSDLLF